MKLGRAKWGWPVVVVFGTVLAHAQTPPPTAIYNCTDAHGRQITADRPIAACADRDQRVLGNSGVELRRIGPTLTAKEREALEAKRRAQQEEERKVREERYRNTALLSRYPNKAAHDAVRAEAVETEDQQISAAHKRIETLQATRKQLGVELEFYQNNPKKAPPQLQRQLRENDDDQQEQLNYIQQREQAKKRINERFDAELLQLQKLWAQTPAKP